MKKFDFEILTYLYVFRSSVLVYAIFMVMYVYMYVYMYMSRGLHEPNFSDRAWPGSHGYNPDPAGPKEKMKFRSEPGPARKGNLNSGPA